MKNLFENWRKHINEEEESNKPKVVCNCLCTDCIFNKNKQCVAEEIKLEWAQTKEDKWICECLTYEVAKNETPGPDREEVEESLQET